MVGKAKMVTMKTAENRFYVYEHLRSDTGAIFYVGKGTKDRSHRGNKSSRSSYWHRIVAKAGGFSVRMVAINMDEELSHLLEIERISQLRSIGIRLCNMTDGGEGVCGHVHDKSSREKMSNAKLGKKLTDAHKSKIGLSGVGKSPSNETKEKISASKRGIKRDAETIKKIALAKTGKSYSADIRKKWSEQRKGIAQQKVICPHCEKIGGISVMKRHHFENCKAK